jgi:hypothetical protein
MVITDRGTIPDTDMVITVEEAITGIDGSQTTGARREGGTTLYYRTFITRIHPKGGHHEEGY